MRCVTLSVEQLETLADLVAERLSLIERPHARALRAEYVDAAGAAEILGVARGWIYAHADAIGGERLGTGVRPRWRFRVSELAKPATDTPPTVPTRHRRSTAKSAGLLVVRGTGRYGGFGTSDQQPGATNATGTRAATRATAQGD